VGLVVSSIGVYTWLAAAALVPAPWSALAMLVLLVIYVCYFSGRWGPSSRRACRKERFRSTWKSPDIMTWALIGGLLVVAFWHSALVVSFRIFEFPRDAFSAGYNTAGMPPWSAWLMIVTASLVAGICEETGYRGYMQLPLETRYGPMAAILLVSAVFLAVHLQQIWAPPLLVHLFGLSAALGVLAYSSGSLVPSMVAHVALDIVNFSYWWTDIAGRFDRQPITRTGIDAHFLTWCLVLCLSAFLFYRVIRKVEAAGRRRQSPRLREMEA
jgi:membrane protease YdiL (CAAX protease family)